MYSYIINNTILNTIETKVIRGQIIQNINMFIFEFIKNFWYKTYCEPKILEEEKNNKEKASVRNESEKTGGNIDDFWTD